MLPPCRRSLEKHAKRANFVAMIWRQARFAMMNVGCPTENGWLADYQVDWIDEAYPPDVEELLMEVPDHDSSVGSDVEYDSEDESSSEEDSTDP